MCLCVGAGANGIVYKRHFAAQTAIALTICTFSWLFIAVLSNVASNSIGNF